MSDVSNHAGDTNEKSEMDALYQSAASPRLHNVIAETTGKAAGVCC